MRTADREPDSIDPATVELDPVFVHARREAVVILTVFGVFFLIVLATCYALGTARSADAVDRALVLGMPHWVWWGIVVPWIAANLVTAWFTLVYMRDDALEAAESLARQQAESGDAGSLRGDAPAVGDTAGEGDRPE